MYRMTVDSITVFGDEAIDAATSVHPLSRVEEERNFWDCDSARWHHEESDSSLGWLFWDLLRYRNQSDLIQASFVPNRFGQPDGYIRVQIHKGDSGEPSSDTYHVFEPQK